MRHDHERAGGRHHRLVPLRLDRRTAELSRRLLSRVVAVAVGFAGAEPGIAQGDEGASEERVVLIYRGHDACPSEEAYRTGVRARTARARFVDADAASRAIDVELTAEAGGTRGRLVITGTRDGRESRREVTGDDCAIVVDALALIAALAIDPAASLTPRASPEPPEPPDEALAPPLPPPDPPSSPSPRAPSRSVPSWPRAVPAEDPRPVASQGAAGAWRPLLAAQLQAASGLGARLAPVLAAFGEVGLDRDDWLSPSFRVAMSWMPPVEVDGVDGSGSFWRWGGQASGCPIGPRPVDIVVLRPCLGFELGALKARGVEVDESFSSSTTWATVVVAARAQMFPSDWMLVELQAELGVPLIRPRYLIDPDATVVSVSPIYGTFSSAFGVRLP